MSESHDSAADATTQQQTAQDLPAETQETGGDSSGGRKVLIGTQRTGGTVKVEPRIKTDFKTADPAASTAAATTATVDSEAPEAASPAPLDEAKLIPKPAPLSPSSTIKKVERALFKPTARVEVPSTRGELSADLAQELDEALGNASLEDLIGGEAKTAVAAGEPIEPDTRLKGRVLRVHRDNVFVELPGRNQGVLQARVFNELPEPGAEIEVRVGSFNAEDGLYEVTLPHGTVATVSDWNDLRDGMIIEVRVTGANKGGLECEVRNLRGFIPASQVSLYRTEDLEQLVGQKFACVITEVKPERRNLVLSRRAVLEREQAESKQQLMQEIAVGQQREGTVRSIRDFGAFVDIGGIDGMLHVSQMSWDRIKHPDEVLKVGQKINVTIQKIDPSSGKISLSYRDQFESPWVSAPLKYPANSRVTGTVSKLMDFGAFIRLEPGVEGLVHISEISYKRVFRIGDVLKEGQSVEAQVLSVDPESQRISLSMKALEAKPGPIEKDNEPDDAAPSPPPKRSNKPLKGGVGQSSGGQTFGLKW